MDLQPVFYPGESSSSIVEAQHVRDATDLVSAQSGNDLEGAALAQAIDKLFEMAPAHDEALRMAFVISAESQSLEKIKSPDFLKSLEDSEALARQLEGRS